jgi:protein phosphatase
MGGLAHGGTASQLAVNTVRELYYAGQGPPAADLVAAAREANQRVFEEAQRLPGSQPMGSTLTALVILEGRAIIAHVGDSRAYRASRGGGLAQLTRDHTLVRELAERGEIEPDSLPYLMHRNVLTRGLGLQEELEVDVIEINDLQVGDTFLLCSDGLYDVVADSEIDSRVVAHGSAQEEFLDDLIELATSRGAPDNVTVLVACVQAAEPVSAKGDWSAGRDGIETPPAGERLAFGFLPQAFFAPLSYFAAFALGALLTLNFQSPRPAPPSQAPSALRAFLDHPRVQPILESEEGRRIRAELERLLERAPPDTPDEPPPGSARPRGE